MKRSAKTPKTRTYDSEATKSRIFAAAAAEFAQHGIAGARIDRIAAQAQANKQLIYCYFGNKEQLFSAVLQLKLEQLVAAITLDPERVPEYVGEVFDFHVANSETIRLVLWEGLHYGEQTVPNEEVRTEHYHKKAAMLGSSQAQGLTDATLDPRYVLFMLMSLVDWWFAAPQVARMLVINNEDPKEARAQYRAHIVEAARRIVDASPQPTSQQLCTSQTAIQAKTLKK